MVLCDVIKNLNGPQEIPNPSPTEKAVPYLQSLQGFKSA
jgi:hypothetical protein